MLIGTKEGSALVFMREIDGQVKTVKYDFKDNNFYSGTKKGNWRQVQSVANFFKGIDQYTLLNSFEDAKYKEFLKIVFSKTPSRISSINTMMQYIKDFLYIESWILSGVNFEPPKYYPARRSRYGWRRVEEHMSGIKDPFSIFPKEVQLFMKELQTRRFNEDWVTAFKQNTELVTNLCTFVRHNYERDFAVYEQLFDLICDRYYGKLDSYKRLVGQGFEYKALFNYMVNISHREAMSMGDALSNLRDYTNMNDELGNTRAVRYPTNLKLRHDITARNYRVHTELMREMRDAESREVKTKAFKENIDYSLDWMDGDWAVVSPIAPDEMVEEGNMLHHCVASYVRYVEDGTKQIMFLRYLPNGNEPLVTLEITGGEPRNRKGGKIGQVSGDGNSPATPKQVEVLRKFAKAKRLFYLDYDPTEDIKKDKAKEKLEQDKISLDKESQAVLVS